MSRKSIRDKIQELRMEERKWMKDRMAALSLAERERKEDENLKPLLAERDALVEKRIKHQEEEKEIGRALQRVAGKIMTILEPHISEELRED
jgi:hypothetical protein